MGKCRKVTLEKTGRARFQTGEWIGPRTCEIIAGGERMSAVANAGNTVRNASRKEWNLMSLLRYKTYIVSADFP